ncbi:hypothetical protein JCM9279_004786 [Rhodotorula babjevae]
MAATAPPRGDLHAFSNPFAQGAPVQPLYSKGKSAFSGQHHHLEQDDGLAISYERLDDRPSYRPDVQLDWNQSNPPHSKRTSSSPQTRMERVDSVFDVYAELYADEDAGEDYAEEEEALGELQRGSSGWGVQPHVVPESPLEEEEAEAEDEDEPVQPWDERGKTGLYGGGGRGADDRETGWVSDFTFALIAPVSGQEEDLRFDADDVEQGETPQNRQFSSRSAQGFHPGEPTRRDSLETAPSSAGPATPPDVGATAAAVPASARENVRPFHPSPALASPPIHTVDAARIKKSNLSPRIPTPSAPMQAGRVAGPLDRSARPRPKASGFKWPARTKKPPTISAPILPEGFVESLGMETFPLYAGAKLPQRASVSAPAGQSRASPRDAASPNPQQPRTAPTRKAAPPVSRTPPRAVPAPALASEAERGSSTLVRAVSTSPPPPARLDAVREEGDSPSSSATPIVKRSQHERTASNMTAGSGFRDPWSAAPASVGSSSSVHSQQTRRVHRGSSYQGGSARASVASTVGGLDPRHFGSSAPVALPNQYSPVDADSPGPTSPVMPDVRHDSLSSHYSEVSEAHEQPAAAFHPSTRAPSDGFRQDFTPFSTTAHLRGASAATLGSTSRGARPFEPVRPLNVHRRTSSTIHPGACGSGDESKRSTLAGDVVWGGAGAGGPRDVSTPVPSRAESPFARAASPFAQHAPTIGTTGFRNPFG